MTTLRLQIDTNVNAKLLAAVLSTMKSVKSISIDKPVQSKYDWINPTRPATEEEIEEMLDECEKGPSFTTKEAKAHSYKIIDEWEKKRKKLNGKRGLMKALRT